MRPHEALDMKTPAEMYESSPRKYEECCLDLEYPSSFLPRRVGSNGCIILKGVKYFLSSALDGWTVGLEPKDGHCYVVWFERLRLAELDIRTQSVLWTEKEAVS